MPFLHVRTLDGFDVAWPCGHVGPTACRQCYGDRVNRLALAEAVCDAVTAHVDIAGSADVADTWSDLMSTHRAWQKEAKA
jgi:hypothetical protein